MNELKHITVTYGGGTARADLDIMPGDQVEQLIEMVLPQFNLARNHSYRVATKDGRFLQGEIYPKVRDGDEVALVREDIGGDETHTRSDVIP